jgi:hypothetical protein
MYLNKILLHLCVLFLFAATSVFANNVTVSGTFDGSEAKMAAAPDSCDDVAKRYHVADTITVSSSGSYTFVDAGNWFSYAIPQGSIADTVTIIYSDSFDSANPANNRLATVDEFESIELYAETSYVLVVQHWCAEINGAYAIVIDGGNATISGGDFTSLPQTIGDFDSDSLTASFSDQGVLRYRSDATTVTASGTYYFRDVGEEFGGSTLSLRIYTDSFDPLNTDANIIVNTNGLFIDSFTLQAGINYVFVVVENRFESQRLQYVLFPPGPLYFNPGLNGAWVADGVEHQGLLMEVLPNAGILFFAHFTFTDQVAVVSKNVSRLTTQTSDSGGAEVPNSLGADDQIWMTAFGSIPASGSYMTINYENSTGGRFNSETPAATINSNYGTGWIEGFSCDHLLINWNLPGGIVDTRDYHKAAQDGVPYCESFLVAGPVSPNW